jgi:copper chaperone CopZ
MITKTFSISGMHCSSCAINIDGELEDTVGVKESSTHYASQKTTVTFDSEKITEKEIISIVKGLGYTALLQK